MGLFTTNQTNTANSVYEETKKIFKRKKWECPYIND